jgi:hypothetical protein
LKQIEIVKKGGERADTNEVYVRIRGPGRRVLVSFTVRRLIETMMGKASEGDQDFYIT